MLKKLTDEQTNKLPEYVKKWVDIGLNCDEADMINSVKWIKEAYKQGGLEEPKFFIGPVNGPIEGLIAEQIVNKFAKDGTEFDSPAHLNELVLAEIERHIKSKEKITNTNLSNQIYGFQDYWLSYYDFFHTECAIDVSPIVPLIELAKYCGWWTPLKNIAIIQHRPSEIHRDSEGRLNNENGPAVRYRGELNNVYAVHGVRVSKKVIDRDYTHKDIENEANAEVRRVMIDLYGNARFIADSGAQLIHSDDFGELYAKTLNGDEPLMMVKVVNSTIEPDGTYKDYYIRVDPKAYGGLKTAHAAVASTWRNKDGSMLFATPEEYVCDIET